MTLLSLLIPTTPDREHFMIVLRQEIKEQVDRFHLWGLVELVINTDNYGSMIGVKRNALLEKATGEYVAFVDDDDALSPDYLKILMDGIQKDADCCSMVGIITEDGKNPKKFIHSIKYDSWFEKDNVYFRPPNHLSCIKSSIAKQFKFPEDVKAGEDHSWSMQIQRSGLLKTEHEVTEPIYFYKYVSPQNR